MVKQASERARKHAIVVVFARDRSTSSSRSPFRIDPALLLRPACCCCCYLINRSGQTLSHSIWFIRKIKGSSLVCSLANVIIKCRWIKCFYIIDQIRFDSIRLTVALEIENYIPMDGWTDSGQLDWPVAFLSARQAGWFLAKDDCHNSISHFNWTLLKHDPVAPFHRISPIRPICAQISSGMLKFFLNCKIPAFTLLKQSRPIPSSNLLCYLVN